MSVAACYERTADRPIQSNQMSQQQQQQATTNYQPEHGQRSGLEAAPILAASNQQNDQQRRDQLYQQANCLRLCTANGGTSFQSVVSSSSLNSYDSATSNGNADGIKYISGGNHNHNSNNIYNYLSSSSTLANGQQVAATSHSSLDSSSLSNSFSLMPINVKGMLLHGIQDDEIMQNWLASIKCQQYLRNFICNGYDMALITRMTPQDLTSIGCKSPLVRRKLLAEIKRLNLDDGIPETRAETLEKWLTSLKLAEYHARLCQEGYDTIDKVCNLDWEDLEEIGIVKLGHQKRLLIGIERLKKYEQLQEDRLAASEDGQFEVHPNHRVSLASSDGSRLSSTLGNRRSIIRTGFFKSRSNASNRDHRGQPIATVMPAFKHINSFHKDSMQTTTITTKGPTQDTASLSDSQSIGNINNINRSSPSNFHLEPPGRHCSPSRPSSQSFGVELLERGSDQAIASSKRYAPPLPPARTNSLKMPHHLSLSSNSNNTTSAYSDSAYISQNIYASLPAQQVVSSTSFLRAPRLGTLTATTNKMLTSGGHLQTVAVQQQTNLRSMQPVREAPPVPDSHQTTGVSRQEALPMATQPDQAPSVIYDPAAYGQSSTTENLINSSLIGHQIAGADEFPPPPPPR